MRFTRRTYYRARSLATSEALLARDEEFWAKYRFAKAIEERGRREKGMWQ